MIRSNRKTTEPTLRRTTNTLPSTRNEWPLLAPPEPSTQPNVQTINTLNGVEEKMKQLLADYGAMKTAFEEKDNKKADVALTET